jgi:hypothetical protein
MLAPVATHRHKALVQYDCQGLALLLNGAQVVAMTQGGRDDRGHRHDRYPEGDAPELWPPNERGARRGLSSVGSRQRKF